MLSGKNLLELYPAFFEHVPASHQPAFFKMLSVRYHALVLKHLSLIEGRSVLDLACGGGAFSYAALAHGCRHVTGIEIAGELIDNAERNMQAQQVARDRYQFVKGDVHQFTPPPGQSFDTVFCFGYGLKELEVAPTLQNLSLRDRYSRFFEQLQALNAQAIIGDLSCPGPIIHAITRRLESGLQGMKIEFFDWIDAGRSARGTPRLNELSRLSFRAVR